MAVERNLVIDYTMSDAELTAFRKRLLHWMLRRQLTRLLLTRLVD
jgi:hypothetical protein